jgi:hypothetical protein
MYTFSGRTVLNNTVMIELALSGASAFQFTANGAAFYNAPGLGGGTGVLALGQASTNPTSTAIFGAQVASLIYLDNSSGNALTVVNPSANVFVQEALAPIWGGSTQNTQAGVIRKYGQLLRTTNATTTTAITIPLPTSSTSAMVTVDGVGRNVTALASSAQSIKANVLNTAGTLSITQTTIFTAGVTTVSITTSGTNILVQVTGTVADNVDWTVEATVIYS